MMFKQKKNIIITCVVCAVIAGLAVAGALIFKSKPKPPDVTPTNATNVVKFIASDQFAKLDDSQKKEYLDKMRDNPDMRNAMFSQNSNLTEEQRQNLRKNMGGVFRKQMKERMNKYFALKTPEEKNKMLDEMIDEMQKMRSEMEKHRQAAGNNSRPQGPPPGGPREGRMRARMENSSPQDRAQMMQFMSDMMARAKARGIQMPGPPGRR